MIQNIFIEAVAQEQQQVGKTGNLLILPNICKVLHPNYLMLSGQNVEQRYEARTVGNLLNDKEDLFCKALNETIWN